MSENITQVSDAEFETQVLQSDTPILVDFWAEWCGPCKALSPILEEVANEYTGRLTVAKLNVDDNPETPQQYGVRGIPTLMLFIKGELADTKVGTLSKTELSTFLDSHLPATT